MQPMCKCEVSEELNSQAHFQACPTLSFGVMPEKYVCALLLPSLGLTESSDRPPCCVHLLVCALMSGRLLERYLRGVLWLSTL